MTLAQAALALCVKGYSVIPIIPRDKVPAVAWKRHQTQPATPEQVMRWWQQRPDYNVGLVTGLVSGVSVCDYDPRHDPAGSTRAHLQAMLPEPNVRTGGGGYHWYLKAAYASVPRLLPGCDFKSNGGYVLPPPSVHPSGCTYLQLRTDVYAMPSELKEMVKQAGERLVGERRESQTKAHTTCEDGMGLDEILSLLVGVKQTRKGWLARCPAHDDHSPSLSVGEGRDGRVLLICYTGCAFTAVMRALRDRSTRLAIEAAGRLRLQ